LKLQQFTEDGIADSIKNAAHCNSPATND